MKLTPKRQQALEIIEANPGIMEMELGFAMAGSYSDIITDIDAIRHARNVTSELIRRRYVSREYDNICAAFRLYSV